MKRIILSIVLCTVLCASCKKSNPSDDDRGEYELPYNNEGVTANKAFIEAEGKEFINKIDDLNQSATIKAIESLSELDVPEIDIVSNSIQQLAVSKSKVAAIHSFLGQIAAIEKSVETYNFKNTFGIYTYNYANDTWEKSPSTDKLEFHFPSVKGGRANNAVLRITSKDSGKTFNDEWTDYRYEYNPVSRQYEEYEVLIESIYHLPSSLTATLTIGNSEVLNLTSSYSYNDDSFPVSSTVNLKLEAYSAFASYSNKNNQADVQFSFSKNNEKLLETSGNSKFNGLTIDKLKNAEGEQEFLDLLALANADFKVGNLKISGNVNFDKINVETRSIRSSEPEYPSWEKYFGSIEYPNYEDYANYEAYQEALEEYLAKYEAAEEKYNQEYIKYDMAYEKYQNDYNTALAKSLNANSLFTIINGKSNKIIASITFELDNKYNELEPLLVFGDGSKLDFETFTETGFKGLINAFEDLIDNYSN